MNWLKLEREWVGKYIHHRNLFNKGKGELSWLTFIIQLLGLPWLFVFAEELKKNWLLLIAAALTYASFCYLIGWYWEKRRHFDLENEWGNERNPMLKKISKAVKKK